MRYLRIDSTGGASGDMLLSALIGAGADEKKISAILEKIVPGEFELHNLPASDHAITGTRLHLHLHGEHPHHHHDHEKEHHHHHHEHRTFTEIRALIENAEIDEAIKRDAVAVFEMLAKAEGKVHGKAPEEVAFHEVGALDSIIDVVGCVAAYHLLRAEGIVLSPVPVGSGTVECAHGTLPVPAPATAELLALGKITVAPSRESGELLTPTGAALLSFWKQVPECAGRIVSCANSFGNKELQFSANLLRVSVVETAKDDTPDKVCEVLCNVDDVSGEALGELARSLMTAGALDVSLIPLLMKKGRPGTMIQMLCTPERRESLSLLLLKQSGAFGLRWSFKERLVLTRETVEVETRFGKIPVKVGRLEGEIVAVKAEFDACIESSLHCGASPAEIAAAAREAFFQNNPIRVGDEGRSFAKGR